jgi:hypothetical protein
LGFLDLEDSKAVWVINLNILEMVNISKLAEYLASLLYNIVLEVWECASLAHCTCRDNIYMEARDIVDILN